MPVWPTIRSAALLAAIAIAPAAAADAPGRGFGGPPLAPPAYGPAPYRIGRTFGPPPPRRGAIIRAYLPRNPNVPMYNEPPPY